VIEPITVVTATVNRKGLRRCVESVQNQTLRPVRHCILLQQIMRSPVIDLPAPQAVPIDIRWIPPPQPNIVQAYNIVESMAETPWVAMLDDDCWWEPRHLETLARLMDRSGADFVWGSTKVHSEETGEEIGMRCDSEPAFEHIDTNEILYRKSCVERWGGFLFEECDPKQLPKLRGIDGRRIERWVRCGAVHAHSQVFTVHYDFRREAEF